MSDFARLETHDGLQVLCYIETQTDEDDNFGPCVITRCDPSISVVVTRGPWTDDDAGWEKAERELATEDLAKFCAFAKTSAVRFSKEATPQ